MSHGGLPLHWEAAVVVFLYKGGLVNRWETLYTLQVCSETGKGK